MNPYKVNIELSSADLRDNNSIFCQKDRNYLEGYYDKPPDLEIHIALAILKRENVPQEIFEPLRRWVKENPMLIIKDD